MRYSYYISPSLIVKRSAAVLLDIVIIFFISSVILLLKLQDSHELFDVYSMLSDILSDIHYSAESLSKTGQEVGNIYGTNSGTFSIITLFIISYYTIFAHFPLKATLGQRIMGLSVLSRDLYEITITKTIQRAVCLFIMPIICIIAGYFFVGIDLGTLQLLEERGINISIMIVLFFMSGYYLSFINRKNRTLHDILSGTLIADNKLIQIYQEHPEAFDKESIYIEEIKYTGGTDGIHFDPKNIKNGTSPQKCIYSDDKQF